MATGDPTPPTGAAAAGAGDTGSVLPTGAAAPGERNHHSILATSAEDDASAREADHDNLPQTRAGGRAAAGEADTERSSLSGAGGRAAAGEADTERSSLSGAGGGAAAGEADTERSSASGAGGRAAAGEADTERNSLSGAGGRAAAGEADTERNSLSGAGGRAAAGEADTERNSLSGAGGRAAAGEAETGAGRRRMGWEVWIVLLLSLGQSGVYAAISLFAKLTAGKPLADQTSTLNASQSVRPYLDLTYQLVGIAFTLVPVALVLWLLSGDLTNVRKRLGLDRRSPGRDLLFGAGLAALIGLPGLALYFIGHALGITTTIVASGLDSYWWTVPVLVLQAVKNAVLEEVIVVGYLVTRLRQLGWPPWAIVAGSAVLRGSYHLYQGIGPFFGNAIMGVIFAEWFRRGGRVMPLIIAHTILDVVSFVGYDLLGSALGLK